MVKISKVEENSRGKGEGIELYVNAMEEARKKGFKRLVSDNETVDEPAIRIYEALERRGYKVDKHPDFKLVTNLKGSNFAYAGDNSAFSIDLSTIPTAKTMTASESLNQPQSLANAVKESDNLKKLADIEQERFNSIMAPLKEEFRSPKTSDNRKQEIRDLASKYRKPLDSANSKLFSQVRAEQPKPKRIPKQEKAAKTFKGTVYHQTNKDFDNFDLNKSSDGTVWFTDNVKNFSSKSSSSSAASGTGKIMERKVDLKKVAGFEELDKFSIQELIEQGYDGAVLDGDIQVFNPKAIKQASTNQFKK
jgi:hypothetical protein